MISTPWEENLRRQTAREARCVVGFVCEGPVRRMSEQGHGLCRKHREQLERGETIRLAAGVTLEARRE